MQGALIGRAVLYGVGCVIYFACGIYAGEAFTYPNEEHSEVLRTSLDKILPWLPGVLVMLPIITYDVLRVSNRFAGPTVRLRRELANLASGQSGQPIVLREDDYWHDVADLYNHVREEILWLRERERLSQESPQEKPAANANGNPDANSVSSKTVTADAADKQTPADENISTVDDAESPSNRDTAGDTPEDADSTATAEDVDAENPPTSLQTNLTRPARTPTPKRHWKPASNRR